MRPIIVLLLSLAWVPVCGQAQTLYRCGSVYQDRPCHGVDSKVVGRGTASNVQGGAPAPIDPACDTLGAAAQKLMWEKESGRTMAEQLARPGANPELVKSVYARRGNSIQVRRAIEADCVTSLEKEREAGLARGRAGAAPQPAGGDPAVGRSGAEPPREVPASQDAQREKASACAEFRSDLDRLLQAQRAGGDAARMDDLRAKVREVQSRQRARGCSTR